MLDRNRRIKPKPERFQANRDLFDVIVSCEERVYDQIIEGKPQSKFMHCRHDFTFSKMASASCNVLIGLV